MAATATVDAMETTAAPVESEAQQKEKEKELPKVKISTKEGTEVEIPHEIAVMSVTIRNMLEDIQDTNGAIPLPNVDASTLKKVVEFCAYHLEHPDAESRRMRGGRVDAFSEWDEQFAQSLRDDQWMLFRTLAAANFLDVKLLLDVCCRTVAGLIKGKTPEEICTLFNIRSDPTEAELKEVRAANPWLNDL